MLGDTPSVSLMMSLLYALLGWLALGHTGTHSSCGYGDVHRDGAALVLGGSRLAESFQEGAVLHIDLHRQCARSEGFNGLLQISGGMEVTATSMCIQPCTELP